MSQEELSPSGHAGQQPVTHACQFTPPDEVVTEDECEPEYILSTGHASASEAISASPNQLPHSKQFGTFLSEAGLAEIPQIRAPTRDEMLPWEPRNNRVAPRVGALLAVLGIGILGGSTYYGLLDYLGRELSGNDTIATIVERIIEAESNGCPNLRNKRSTAAGAGQFLDETWVRLIRAHRPDIARRSEGDVLELRRDPELAREITTRLAEQNAAKLRKHGISVTKGTLYLSHFAGIAGAVAILSAPESADAASVMASADVTGRTTREKVVNANPFLQRFTVADLKGWADSKMEKKQVNQICGPLQQSGSVGMRSGSAVRR